MNEFIYYFCISFVGAMVLIFLAKVVMNKPIRKDKDYYETGEREEEMRMLRNANLKKSKNGGRK